MKYYIYTNKGFFEEATEKNFAYKYNKIITEFCNNGYDIFTCPSKLCCMMSKPGIDDIVYVWVEAFFEESKDAMKDFKSLAKEYLDYDGSVCQICPGESEGICNGYNINRTDNKCVDSIIDVYLNGGLIW